MGCQHLPPEWSLHHRCRLFVASWRWSMLRPLFKSYLDLMCTLCIENPPPTLFPMKPENMLYYHGPQVIAARNNDNCPDANHCQAIVSTVMVDNCHGLCHLSKSSLDLAISAGLHRQPHILSTMMNFFVMIYRSCNSVGWYTSFREDTLFWLSNLATCRFMSSWLAPIWIGTLPISGIHVMPPHLWYCKWYAQSHLVLRGHLGHPWIHDTLSSFSNQLHDHKVLVSSGRNHLWFMSHTITLNCCCHYPSRPWWL